MKTHYELLGLETTASADDIKRSFRREIARYHPDKVQHLGPEFQEIAATRAAELTEAYRVLMDVEERRKYDEALTQGPGRPVAKAGAAPRRPPVRPPEPADAPPRPAPADPSPPPPTDRRFAHERATTSDFVKKAALGKLRTAVGDVAGSVTPLGIAGFDAAFLIKVSRSLFKKAEPPVRLLVRFVPLVDGHAVEEAWPLAARSGTFDGTVCLMLLGADGFAPQKDLAQAISEQRRKTRNASLVLVPIDVRDWEALFPPEAPQSIRAVVQRLRDGKM